MKTHTCSIDKTCCCSVAGFEPNEKCPKHGFGQYPPRCGKCGKFMSIGLVVKSIIQKTKRKN
jgi:hypothetical protein